MYFPDQALNSEDNNMFSLSTSKRPDSERLLYSSAGASTRRPPTAPLSPENLDSNFAEKPALANLFEGEWTADTRLSHIMSYLQDATPRWRDVDPFTPVLHATMSNGLTPLPTVYSQPREWPLQQRNYEDGSSTRRRDTPSVQPQTPGQPQQQQGSTQQQTQQPKAPAKGWWKTEICKFWKESGGCRNEGNCRWAHGEHELRKLEPSPEHSFVPPTARSEQMELWTSWVTVNWGQCAKARRGTILRSLWESVSAKNQAVTQLEENILIADSGLKLGLEYWNAVADLFTAPKGACTCDLCGEDGGTPQALFAACLAISACPACLQVVEAKAATLSLVPAGSSGMPANNDRRKLIYWGMTLLTFMKHLEDSSWSHKGVDIIADTATTTAWTRHRRLIARGALLIKRYLDGLALSRRVRLLTTELLPALSLLDWSAAAGQPKLFVPMLVCGFPLPESSVADQQQPSSLVPFSPRKPPASTLTTSAKRKNNKINNSPSAETAASPSPQSPFESEEGVLE